MSTLGVMMSQKWTLVALEVAKSKMDDLTARVKVSGFSVIHDNLNRMARVAHQRIGHNSHFDSGTAATVWHPPDEDEYKLPATNKKFLEKTAEGAMSSITSDEIQELYINAAPRILSQNVVCR